MGSPPTGGSRSRAGSHTGGAGRKGKDPRCWLRALLVHGVTGVSEGDHDNHGHGPLAVDCSSQLPRQWCGRCDYPTSELHPPGGNVMYVSTSTLFPLGNAGGG